MIENEPQAAPHDLQLLARRRWPLGRHPGGLGWELATDQLPEVLEVFRPTEGEVEGWAGIERPGVLTVEAEPHVAPEAFAAALAAAATGDVVQINVADGDHALRAAVEEAGFTPAHPWYGSWRTASVGDRPTDIARGCLVRAMRDGEDDARIEVHRRAWRPADLPWHPDHRPPTAPDAESGFGGDQFGRVQASWLYDRALDLVVEAPDGELVACCTASFDPALGVAEIEPLGVVPSHRRLGLAGALCLEVSARIAELGGREVFINAGPRVDYPANGGAYAKAGFEARVRGQIWGLRR
jgi:GNAT superfamily N-acetyltransferase